MLAPYWKKIGFSLAAIFTAVYFALDMRIDFKENAPYAGSILEALLIICFVIPILSKEKIEDELLKKLRMISIVRAFLTTLGFSIIMTLFHEIRETAFWSANLVLIYQLILYHIFFYSTKNNEYNKEDYPKWLQ